LLVLALALASSAALFPRRDAPRAAPSGPSYLFLSPNIDDHLSLAEASRRLVSPAHKQYGLLAGDILRQLGVRGAEVHDAVGDWCEGVENSLVVVLPSAEPDTLRCAAAWFGLAAQQKAVLAFYGDPAGADVLNILDLPGRDLAAARWLLDRHGVRDRAIRVHPRGSQVLVLDAEGRLGEALGQLARHSRGRLRCYPGRGESLAGPTRLQARQRYAEVIRAYQVSRPLPSLARLGR
jgi:hypothetical protein